jgi:hypothetical protein
VAAGIRAEVMRRQDQRREDPAQANRNQAEWVHGIAERIPQLLANRSTMRTLTSPLENRAIMEIRDVLRRVGEYEPTSQEAAQIRAAVERLPQDIRQQLEGR